MKDKFFPKPEVKELPFLYKVLVYSVTYGMIGLFWIVVLLDLLGINILWWWAFSPMLIGIFLVCTFEENIFDKR